MRIRVKNLTKRIESQAGPLTVLDRLNLEIPRGQFTAIMGPSGAGKTSLLFLLGCLDQPTYGKIFLEDVEATAASEAVLDRVRLHNIGFIFQQYHLLPTLTALENVMLPMELAKLYQKDGATRALSLLRLVGLEQKWKERPGALSGGEQQRVAIARALANLPSLLLADEPTGNLDSKASQEVMGVLQLLSEKQDLTIVVVTHDPKVASYAKKIFYLDDGVLRTTVL